MIELAEVTIKDLSKMLQRILGGQVDILITKNEKYPDAYNIVTVIHTKDKEAKPEEFEKWNLVYKYIFDSNKNLVKSLVFALIRDFFESRENSINLMKNL